MWEQFPQQANALVTNRLFMQFGHFLKYLVVSLEYIVQSGPSPVPSFTCAGFTAFYMNTTDFCTATQLYRDSACTRGALAGYYNTGSFYRYWNGSSFTLSCTFLINHHLEGKFKRKTVGTLRILLQMCEKYVIEIINSSLFLNCFK